MTDPGPWAFRVNEHRDMHSRQKKSHYFMPCDQRQINTFSKSKSDRGHSLIPPPSMYLCLANAMPNALFLAQLPFSLQCNKSASSSPLFARAPERMHLVSFWGKLCRSSLGPLNCSLALYIQSHRMLQFFLFFLCFDRFIWRSSAQACLFTEDVIWEAV